MCDVYYLRVKHLFRIYNFIIKVENELNEIIKIRFYSIIASTI